MKAARIAAWALIATTVATIVFLAATIRVVEPRPAPVMDEAVPTQPPAIANAPAMIVPVAGVDISALRSNWGEARGEGRAHQGLDIIAPGGTSVIAAADGTVEKLYYSQGGGGITLYQRAADRGWMFYYAHLGGYAPGIAEGQAVRAGDTIAYVGDTGNAGAGNHHLHFGVARMAPGERWWQGSPVDPYPLLAASRAGG